MFAEQLKILTAAIAPPIKIEIILLTPMFPSIESEGHA